MPAKSRTVIAAAALSALSLVALTDHADARERRAGGSVVTQRGTYTGQARIERHRGSRTRDTVVTGPNGGQRTSHDERTWSRREGIYSRDRVTTYNDGSTRTVDVDAARTGQGQYSVSREVTGRNGETRAQTGEFTVERTENGRTVSGDIATANAGQIDYQRSVSRQDGARGVDASAAFEDGRTISRSSQASCAGGVCSSSGVVAFPDGSTRSVEGEVVGNGDGSGSFTRTVTGRDGETRTQTGEYQVTP